MESSIPYVREILIFLTTAGVIVPLFQKFKISPVLGFLLAGLALGPHGIGTLAHIWPTLDVITITHSKGVHALAELGIVFLLFTIGLELSFERLLSMRRKVFGFGMSQVLISTLAIGTVSYFFGNSAPTSLLLGLGFALSSTAIVMQILSEKRRLGSVVGRNSFAILLFQDLSVVLLLFIIGFLGPDMQGELSSSLTSYIFKALGFALGAVAIIVVAGRLILRPLFNLVGKTHNKELFMATTLLAVIGIATLASTAGLSMALGAFLAGLLLAETEYRHDVEMTIEPFKGLLLGLFFMSVGMSVNLGAILEDPFWIPAAVIGLFLVKGSIIYALGRAIKLPSGQALELGLLLGQAGEFAFVLLALANHMHIIPIHTAQFMLVVSSLSMMATPLVARLAHRLNLAIDGPDQSIYGPALPLINAMENHVIIAGYGRMGQLMADILNQQRIPALAIENDLSAAISSNKIPVLCGDAATHEVLMRAGLMRAAAVAVLIDETRTAKRVVETVHRLTPNISIVARARDANVAADLYKLGAHATIPDVVEGSLQLAQELLVRLGLSTEAASSAINTQRQQEAHAIMALMKDAQKT